MKRALLVCGSPEHCADAYSRPYEEALKLAGVDALVIRPADAVPGDFPGMVLIGGSDVNPSLYSAPRHPHTEGSDDARDALESRLIADALARDLPILAICRGMQILNVQQGGTLIQHLRTTEHHRRRTADRGLPVHKVSITRGTKLSEIARGDILWDVNSRHHQAIDLLGSCLCVSAVDPDDGVIEAVERRDKRFVLGVQWHPENQAPTDERQARLFAAFAAAL